ncbi:MAG: esterase-like activity of phytase family protein [Methyloligellaceae bacterium]
MLAAMVIAGASLIYGCAGAKQDPIVSRVALDPNHPKRTEFGQLVWRGGLVIRHSDDRFGGLSGLHMSADGNRMTAVTDRGSWVTARLHYRGGDLAGLSDLAILPILGENGRAVGWRSSDAESIAPDGNGGFFIAFERHHRFSRYADRDRGALRALPTKTFAPKSKWRQPTNGGYEGLTRLCDGRLLAIAETARPGSDVMRAWIGKDGKWRRLSYTMTGKFRPTGAATLPDCSVVVLERRFNFIDGLAIRLVRLPAASIQPGAKLRGREIARLGPTLTIDNMEGIAARRGAHGETLLYLVSDDNFTVLQRTLLHMFELQDKTGP